MDFIRFRIELDYCRDLTAEELAGVIDRLSVVLDEAASVGQLDLEAATLEDYDIQHELY